MDNDVKRIPLKSTPLKIKENPSFLIRQSMPFCMKIETNKLCDSHEVYKIEYKESALTVYRHKIPLYTKIIPYACVITFNASVVVVYANNYIIIYSLHKGTLLHPHIYAELSWIELVGEELLTVTTSGETVVYRVGITEKSVVLSVILQTKLPKNGPFLEISLINSIPFVRYENESFFFYNFWVSLHPHFENTLSEETGGCLETMDEIEALIEVNKFIYENSIKVLTEEEIKENLFFYTRKFVGIIKLSNFVDSVTEYKIKRILRVFISGKMTKEFYFLLKQLNSVTGLQKLVLELETEFSN
ncbi:hypothetical protein NUSPORA_02858 [Nucleospora cyclopteri]